MDMGLIKPSSKLQPYEKLPVIVVVLLAPVWIAVSSPRPSWGRAASLDGMHIQHLKIKVNDAFCCCISIF
jgi:hypothetical protein